MSPTYFAPISDLSYGIEDIRLNTRDMQGRPGGPTLEFSVVPDGIRVDAQMHGYDTNVRGFQMTHDEADVLLTWLAARLGKKFKR